MKKSLADFAQSFKEEAMPADEKCGKHFGQAGARGAPCARELGKSAPSGGEPHGGYAQGKEELEAEIKNLSSLPEKELWERLCQQVAMQKQNGTFDKAALERSLDSMGAFLTAEQRQNIKEILGRF